MKGSRLAVGYGLWDVGRAFWATLGVAPKVAFGPFKWVGADLNKWRAACGASGIFSHGPPPTAHSLKLRRSLR